MCPDINHFTSVLFLISSQNEKWLDHVSVYKTFDKKFKGKQENNKNMANIPWTCRYVKPVKP